MKGSKLIEIYKNGNIVIPIYFLKIYKKLRLELDEFIFLMYLYNCGEKFLFDPNKISNDLNMEVIEVMNAIDILTNKGFIKVEVLKNDKGFMEESILLNNFYEKIALFTMEEINKKDENESSNSSIFETIEKEFGRTLSPMEIEIIKAWLDSNINEELIKEALKEATFNGVSNLRYIDKILFEWGKNNIKTVKDVEDNRRKRNTVNEKENDIDLDALDWDWFDSDE